MHGRSSENNRFHTYLDLSLSFKSCSNSTVLNNYLSTVKNNINRMSLIYDMVKCENIFYLDSLMKYYDLNRNVFVSDNTKQDDYDLKKSDNIAILTKIVYEYKLSTFISNFRNKLNKTSERIKVADNLIKHLDYTNYKRIDVKYFDFLKTYSDNLSKLAEELASYDNNRLLNETKIRFLNPLHQSLKLQEILIDSNSDSLSKKFNLVLNFINKNYLNEIVLLEKSNFYHFIKSINNVDNMKLYKDLNLVNTLSDKIITNTIEKIESNEKFRSLGKDFKNLYSKYGFIDKSDVLNIAKNLKHDNINDDFDGLRNQFALFISYIMKNKENDSIKSLNEIYENVGKNIYKDLLMKDDLNKIKLYFMLNELSKNI